MKHRFQLFSLLSGLLFTITPVHADDLLLMESPVKVTATLHPLDEGGSEARIAVHNGPIAQLVNTTLSDLTTANAASLLRRQLSWQAPYLIVHSSCNINTVRRCGGDVVFKVMDGAILRLGDFVVTENPIYSVGKFYDDYDKLGEAIAFTLVLVDSHDVLQVDADATWASNAAVWKIRSTHIASVQPAHDWNDAEWEKYFDAVMNNAALARYCNRTEELQQLLDTANPLLDADHRRLLADNLSKVVPLEKPKAWRKMF